MAGALFFLSLFLITVCSLLLFKPPVPSDTITDYKTITEYSQPAAVEARQQVTLKMAQFLEKNPEIVKQKTLTSLPLSNDSVVTASPQKSPIPREIHTSFQGSGLRFQSLNEYNQWVYKNVSQDAIGFLKQLHSNNNPELYLDTLEKVSQINPSEQIIGELKSSYLSEAKDLISNPDGFHQQMAQRALQQYLDLEKDKDLGKKTMDDFLRNNVKNQ